jgi:HSP20 family protein
MGKLARRLGMEKEGTALAPRSWPSVFGPRFMEDIEQMFAGMWRPWWSPILGAAEAPEVPAVDMFEEGDAIVLKAELPGLKKEEVEVEVTGDAVTISGTKEKEEKIEKKDYYRYERASGEFSRSVTLPVEVEAGKATAQLKDGVLEVRAPKKEGAQPKARKITIA